MNLFLQVLDKWHRTVASEVETYKLYDTEKLLKLEVVCGLSKLSLKITGVCSLCQIRKQTKIPHRKQRLIATSICLELVHMDLIGPTQVESVGGKKNTYIHVCVYVCVDDYSRYNWVFFLTEKSNTLAVFKKLWACLLVFPFSIFPFFYL